MEANQWAQEIGRVKTMAEIGGPCSSSRAAAAVHVQSSSSSERKGRPQKDQVVNCPRCQSTNTKFCYYNNYSLTQPRYFCKTCRRYWTAGGTLRNVPVGGGSRKNRRSSSSSSSSASTQKIPDANLPNISQYSSSNPNHKIHDQGHDLNLTFPYGQEYHFAPQIQLFEFPRYETNNGGTGTGTVPPPHELIKPSSSAPFAALELLRNGFSSSSSNSHIIEASGQSTSDRVYNNVGFPFQELKPTTGLSFSVDRFGSNNRYAGSNGIIQLHDDQNNNCEKVMFPLEASMKQNPAAGGALGDGSTHNHMQQQNKGQQISNGCWNGMLGGGAW